jgi:glutathione S-transferase
MLDSPYVRRVAISLQLLDLGFEHQALSVFRTFAEFQKLNPVVKAPTLICDDGTVLMDSTLILDYAEVLARPRSLFPATPTERTAALRIIGLALAACEKSVQIIYERGLRPPEKLHQPWVDRVTGQLLAAYDGLEQELGRAPLAKSRDTIDQADVTTAVAWHFTQRTARDRACRSVSATRGLLGHGRVDARLHRRAVWRQHISAGIGRSSLCASVLG